MEKGPDADRYVAEVLKEDVAPKYRESQDDVCKKLIVPYCSCSISKILCPKHIK